MTHATLTTVPAPATAPAASAPSVPAVQLALSAPANLRDLGGVAIAGGRLRPGLAIRADDLATITEAAAAGLVRDGLAAVIDLRSPLEVGITGRGPLAGYPLAYHHVPLIANVGATMPKEAPQLDHAHMGEMYTGMVETAAPQLVTALNIIAYAPGVTAFHCAAGRDRTGVLAAVLLLALGASDAEIVADYARTGANMVAIIDRTRPVMSAMFAALDIAYDPADAGGSGGMGGLLNSGMESSMRILLDGLRERHGDPLAPLRAAGLGDDTIARLRERALGQ
ncbi:tyrosine-protein phosphatase [Leucobacter luti]|uniref:Tyrosine phosphatase family protein n=1 Tax=Leucobacter luti TaxID=340320 RepID=A0A4Q7U7G5_9MICO|nr:tyrosine-protein phosphatase [Leucobacter luti]MBL3700914.1 tyrosine-protein phosphatase [Leucobacter luti]RZT68867.1 tyrosine phosphatase family protein [Leucobacter luti]